MTGQRDPVLILGLTLGTSASHPDGPTLFCPAQIVQASGPKTLLKVSFSHKHFRSASAPCQAASASFSRPCPWFPVSHIIECPKTFRGSRRVHGTLEHHDPRQRQQAPPGAGEWVRLAPVPSLGIHKIHPGPIPTSASNHQGTSNITAQGSPDILCFLSSPGALHSANPSLPTPISSHAAGVIHLFWGASSHPASTLHPVATQGPVDLSTD